MNAQELRLGNLIRFVDTKEPCLIYEIEHRFKKIYRINDINDNKDIEPIPLDEEWLLKFGWVWNPDTKSFEKFPYGDARMHLEFRDVSQSYTMFNYVLKALIAERIYYVHQLQNLYFALTGKELEMIN